jgi:hypothetical protein
MARLRAHKAQERSVWKYPENVQGSTIPEPQALGRLIRKASEPFSSHASLLKSLKRLLGFSPLPPSNEAEDDDDACNTLVRCKLSVHIFRP